MHAGTLAWADDEGCASDFGRQVCTRDASGASEWASLCAWLEDDCHFPVMGRFYQGSFERNGLTLRGVGSVHSMRKGDLLGCIPRSCLMYKSDKRRSAAAKGAAQHPSCGEQNGASLALYVAEEARRGNESRFAPFLRLLPGLEDYRKFHPAFLGTRLGLSPEAEDRWAIWQGPGNFTETMRSCYDSYLKLVPDTAKAPTFEETFLAFVQVLSRRFSTTTLIPFADGMNMGALAETNVDYFVARDDHGRRSHVCLEASADIAAGAELLIDYEFSDRAPLEFFEVFGFTMGVAHHAPAPPNMCQGLSASEFAQPAADASPVLWNYWRFAREHCG